VHHCRVDGEAEGSVEATELVRVHRPSLLVVDEYHAGASWNYLVGEARALVPGLRVILVAPVSRPPRLPDDPSQRPDVVLLRPFRIRQFADALVPPVAPASPRTSSG